MYTGHFFFTVNNFFLQHDFFYVLVQTNDNRLSVVVKNA